MVIKKETLSKILVSTFFQKNMKCSQKTNLNIDIFYKQYILM